MPTQESHKPMIRKCKKRKVYSWFKNKIWSADLGDMELISNFIKNFDVYYALLIFIVTMLCVSCSFNIWKKILQLLMLFKNFKLSLIENQTKYGGIKKVNFTIDQWNPGYKVII